jgi:hypothetical protein
MLDSVLLKADLMEKLDLKMLETPFLKEVAAP